MIRNYVGLCPPYNGSNGINISHVPPGTCRHDTICYKKTGCEHVHWITCMRSYMCRLGFTTPEDTYCMYAKMPRPNTEKNRWNKKKLNTTNWGPGSLAPEEKSNLRRKTWLRTVCSYPLGLPMGTAGIGTWGLVDRPAASHVLPVSGGRHMCTCTDIWNGVVLVQFEGGCAQLQQTYWDPPM